MNYKREKTRVFQKTKILIISFAIIGSAIIGLILPVVISQASEPPFDNSVGKSDELKNEPDFNYVSTFFFKEDIFEIFIEDENNMLVFLISEKNGVTDYGAITDSRVDVASGETKCVEITHKPFSMKTTGIGKNKIFLTATQRNGTKKTISTTIVVKEREIEKENKEIKNEQPPSQKDNHSISYVLNTERIIIRYYINGDLQESDSFKLIAVSGAFIGELVGEGYIFYALENWEIIVRHNKTGTETVIRSD